MAESTPWKNFINLKKETLEQEMKNKICEQMLFDKLTFEEEIFQELLEELRKQNINFDEYEFYFDDEGNENCIIPIESKPVKIIFEKQ